MLLLASCLLFAAQDASPASPIPPSSDFERVVVVGASVSAGFGLHRDLGQPAVFGAVLDAAIAVPHGDVASRADLFFSHSPDGVGRLMIDSVLATRPTLVVAIDFLFWFGYGAVPDEQRLKRLERGFTLLEELECRVVVADLPDMSPATRGIMLSASQVPSPATLALLNQRVRAWVAADPKRHLIGFADCVDRIRARAEIAVGPVHWPAERAPELLQPDDLHPTLRGAALIAGLVGEVLTREVEGLGADAFDADVSAIASRVRERVMQERREFEKRVRDDKPRDQRP